MDDLRLTPDPLPLPLLGGASPAPLDRDILNEDGSMDDMGYSREEEFVYYMLAPPWARHKDPILYLQQFQN